MKTESEFDLPEDARVRATAWALDQLDTAERAAFEKEMAASPALAEYARDMRRFSGLLTDEWPAAASDAETRLPDDRRDKVLAALEETPSNVRRFPFSVLKTLAAAAAAALAVAAVEFWRNSDPGNHAPARKPYVVASLPPADPSGAPQPPPVTIRPAMPQPLFVGTPLPQLNAPPNLDVSGKPVLEVMAPAGTVLISKGCLVTSNDPNPIGELSWITDGEKNGADGYYVDLQPGPTWIQIDLGASREIWLLWVWHFHKQNVIFNDVVARISDDPEFKTFTTVFNNDWDDSLGFGKGPDPSYIETNNGRAMPVNGVTGRYVRLYSNGRDLDDTNQYIEVEVYGRPASPLPMLAAAPVLGESELRSDLHAAKKASADSATAVVPASFGNSILVPEAASAPAEPAKLDAIRPAMPAPLFVGTPLPRGNSSAAETRSLSSLADAAAVPAQSTSLSLYAEESLWEAGRDSHKNAYRSYFHYQIPAEAGGADPAQMVKPGTSPQAESYQSLPRNEFQDVTRAPLSTFSIDVDTASYANVRRFLNQGVRPPAEAVRLEEMVNYFPYEVDPPPQDGKPFAVRVDVTAAPWQPAHRLARIVLKGRELQKDRRPPTNLVFLVDVSGSMADANKLPLVQQSLRLLTERLTENDRVSLVTYAGSSAVVLPSTNGAEKPRILAAIESLTSGGGTNGAGGITAAYDQAAAHFLKEGVNRVILATDGDFNIGVVNNDDLLKLIQDRAKTGVFLSVLGYGMGNLKDDRMEMLADKGNGNYAYIDSLSEARKALVEQMDGTLVTIAKDVKIQIEFNPAAVRGYRLLGYENRLLAKEDFNDDKKDAGEIGAGHTVTALYEIIPAGAPDNAPVPVVDGLKYQQVAAVSAPKPEVTPAALTGEMMNVKLRWKRPDGDVSELLETPVKDDGVPLEAAAAETRWAAAVAGFARLLRGETDGGLTWESVRNLARGAKGADPLGYRGEFLQLIDKAESLSR